MGMRWLLGAGRHEAGEREEEKTRKALNEVEEGYGVHCREPLSLPSPCCSFSGHFVHPPASGQATSVLPHQTGP